MVPVRDTGGRITFGCTNPWHPQRPGPCPACRHRGRPRTPVAGMVTGGDARCPSCGHVWPPFPTVTARSGGAGIA